MKKHSSGGLVYSTDQGRMCPECREPLEQCRCKAKSPPKGDGVVRVQRETKGRKARKNQVDFCLPLYSCDSLPF